MDHPTIALQLDNDPTSFSKDNLIEAKLLDSVSSLQNLPEVMVVRLHEEFPIIQLQINQNPTPKLELPQKVQQAQIKIEHSEEDSSGDSGDEEIKDVVKSGRQQKFKRSTNNSHKKFISVARRWLFKNHRGQLKVAFQNKFHNFRSTRTYFFIILSFIKTIMNEQKQRQFQTHFTKQVSLKILEYQKQIENTTNENLKHFRSDEVTDLKFSIKACDVYFEGDLDKSIECVYKKDKITIVKKHHYEEALKTVRGIESEFKDPNFLQNTINMYGGKKLKKRLTQNEDWCIKNGESENERDHRCMYFVAESFGLKVGYVSQAYYSSKKYRQIRIRRECGSGQTKIEEQVVKGKVELNAENIQAQPLEGKDEMVQSEQGRKLVKVVLVPVTNKMEQQENANSLNQTIVQEEIKLLPQSF